MDGGVGHSQDSLGLLSVTGHDRIDVRRVHDRQPTQVRVVVGHEGHVPGRFELGEQSHVLRMTPHRGVAGGRSECTGHRDIASGQRVDDGRLAASRRSEQGDHQRAFGVGEPGDEVSADQRRDPFPAPTA